MANYTATVGGTPVNVIGGSLHVENQIGTRSTGGFSVWSALGVTWTYGTQVQVYDETGALSFAGYVSKDKATKAGGAPQGTGYLEHELRLMDNCYRADKRRAFGQFLNQSAGSIVLALVATILAAEGVTVTPTSVATGATIVEAVWTYNKSVSEALSWLAQQCGYWWTIDTNGVLWFQPYAGLPAPFVLDGTQVDAVAQDVTVEYGNEQYVNSQFTKGSYQETPQLTETLIGNGQSRSFTLSCQISSIKRVLLNGSDITKQLGTKDQIGGGGFPFYYAAGDAVIAQDPGQALLGAGDQLVVTYRGRTPTIARAQNPALIAAQKTREGGIGTGLVESTYANTKVRTQAAAFQIASSLLAHFGQDMAVLTFATRSKGLLEGQMLTVNLPDFNLSNKPMLITGITLTDQIDDLNVWFVVTAVGSPYDAAQWQTYFANLMNQSNDPTDLTDVADGAALALISSTTINRTATVSVTQLKVIGAVCGVSSGPQKMICGQWTVC